MGEYNGVVGGVSSIVTDGFQPWWYDMKGTIDPIYASDTLTADEAFKHVLDWPVEKRVIYVDSPDGLIEDDDHVAVVRADTNAVLGIHSDTYGVVQNTALRDFVKALKQASAGDVYITSAGTLFDDKVAWMLAKLGEDRYFGDGNTIQSYFLAATSHDGSISLSGRPTNVRVECMNTFDWAIKKTSSIVNLRHTRNVADYIPQAVKAIEKAYEHFGAMDDEIAELLDIEYTRQQFTGLVEQLVGDAPNPDESKRSFGMWERKRDGLLGSWNRPDQQNINGTAWGAVMAVNSFELWGANVRGGRAQSQARKALTGSFPLTQQARALVVAA